MSSVMNTIKSSFESTASHFTYGRELRTPLKHEATLTNLMFSGVENLKGRITNTTVSPFVKARAQEIITAVGMLLALVTGAVDLLAITPSRAVYNKVFVDLNNRKVAGTVGRDFVELFTQVQQEFNDKLVQFKEQFVRLTQSTSKEEVDMQPLFAEETQKLEEVSQTVRLQKRAAALNRFKNVAKTVIENNKTAAARRVEVLNRFKNAVNTVIDMNNAAAEVEAEKAAIKADCIQLVKNYAKALFVVTAITATAFYNNQMNVSKTA